MCVNFANGFLPGRYSWSFAQPADFLTRPCFWGLAEISRKRPLSGGSTTVEAIVCAGGCWGRELRHNRKLKGLVAQ